MAKVIMTCGNICSGKSTYAEKLRSELGGTVLSIDELMTSVLGRELGDLHDEYVRRCERYLYKKAAEIAAAGTNVILDWGFWKKSQREYAREYFCQQGIACEFHYITVSDEEWERRIAARNAEVTGGRSDVYFIDSGLLEKFRNIFEVPDKDEIDVWIE